jgi:hypothetical protein
MSNKFRSSLFALCIFNFSSVRGIGLSNLLFCCIFTAGFMFSVLDAAASAAVVVVVVGSGVSGEVGGVGNILFNLKDDSTSVDVVKYFDKVSDGIFIFSKAQSERKPFSWHCSNQC